MPRNSGTEALLKRASWKPGREKWSMRRPLMSSGIIICYSNQVIEHILAETSCRPGLALGGEWNNTDHLSCLGSCALALLLSSLILSSSSSCFSVPQTCPSLCDPMNRSTPALPVHYQLPKFTQTDVHRVGDAIQPSHPLSSPSPPAFNPSQHQGLFQSVCSSHQVAKVLEFQLQHQSFQ